MTPAAALTNELTKQMSLRFPTITVWRNNTGGAVGMSVIKAAVAIIRSGNVKKGCEMLMRPIAYGFEGSADLIGMLPGGRFLGIEIKAGDDKQSPTQESFQHLVETHGGVYLICRNVPETITALRSLL